MPSGPSKLLERHRRNRTQQSEEDREARIRRDHKKERAKLEFDWPDVEKRKAEKRRAKEQDLRDRDQQLGKQAPESRAELGEDGKQHINFWAGLEKDVRSYHFLTFTR